MEYQSLSELLDNLERESKAHICLLDISGMLRGKLLDLPSRRWSHSGSFCSAAKTTARGLSLCLSCKELTNRKAKEEGTPFWGTCPYGLSEIVWPVRQNGVTKCIIFVGNLVLDEQNIRKKIQKACHLTKVDPKRLFSCLPQTQNTDSIEPYRKIAYSAASYLSLLSEHFPSAQRESHWAVDALREYANCHFEERITLGDMAKIYFLNEKYLGRLFFQQVGVTFHQYLNQVRLKHFAQLLCSTNQTILETALNCGFGNVTYCNRLFLKQFGCSPKQYRKQQHNFMKVKNNPPFHE